MGHDVNRCHDAGSNKAQQYAQSDDRLVVHDTPLASAREPPLVCDSRPIPFRRYENSTQVAMSGASCSTPNAKEALRSRGSYTRSKRRWVMRWPNPFIRSSSAGASSAAGKVTPSAFAAIKLTRSAGLEAWQTGILPVNKEQQSRDQLLYVDSL